MHTFRAHAEACPLCRAEYENEAVTKNLIRSRVRMQRTPSDLMVRITDLLDRERRQPASAFRRWWSGVLTMPYLRPVLAFGAACLAVILLLRGEGPAPGSVIDQSFANYRAVVAGNITPQVLDSLPARVAGFFTGKTTFPVHVPRLRHASLVGGVLNDYDGIPLAHLVYRHGSDIVYVYQACWNEVQRGDRLQIPDDVRERLRQTGWYSATRPDGYSIVLWADDSTLCSAVAKMPKDDLVACIAQAETPGRQDR
jgi:anti-sigma factor RsiW